jgi:hypothetical protein
MREKFCYHLGVFYAGLGGTFGYYRTAEAAFEAAKVKYLYRGMNLDTPDFTEFEKGFKDFQVKRIALQEFQRDSQEEMSKVLHDFKITDIVVSDAKNYTELK